MWNTINNVLVAIDDFVWGVRIRGGGTEVLSLRLLDENGNALATLSAEVCTLKIPAHTVRMIKFN